MMALDIAYFPHIFDLVFEFADARALARLRSACRALRAKVDKEWGHVECTVLPRKPMIVRNKRGDIVPTDSVYLRLTTTVDMRVAPGALWRVIDDVPTHLDPKATRFLHNYGADTFPTDAFIIYNPENALDCVSAYRQQQHMHVIYRLEHETMAGRGYLWLDGLSSIEGAADVFIVATGCDLGDYGSYSVEQICEEMLRTLINRHPREDIQFYLVDIPSWFKTPSTATEGPQRLDKVLAEPDTFYGFMLKCMKSWLATSGEREDGRPWWPSAQDLQHLTRIRSITKAELRQHVGDKAYELTYASTNLFPQG